MRLGTQTGSLINHIHTAGADDPVPAVGDGATIFHWTDRSPATVIAVDTSAPGGQAVVTVQEDIAVRTDKNGMSEMQDYEFSADPDGAVHTYRNQFDGKGWRRVRRNPETGRLRLVSTTSDIRFGARAKYHDFSF